MKVIFKNIIYLGSAMYFSIVTLTTVGFGDIVPVTTIENNDSAIKVTKDNISRKTAI